MTTKNLWTIAGSFLMAVALFATVFLGVMPTIFQVQTIDKNRAAIWQENYEKSSFLLELKKTSEHKIELLKSVSEQRELFPANLNLVEYMAGINEISQATGVTISNFSVSAAQPFTAPTSANGGAGYAKALTELPEGTFFFSETSMSLTGSVSQLKAALQRLRSAPRYILISKLVLPEIDSSKSESMTIDLSAQIFSVHPK